MKTHSLLLAAASLFFANSTFAEDGVAIPYNSVNTQMKILKSQNIKGVDCVSWFVKDQRKDKTLDTAKANFRIRTWEGVEYPLDIEALSSLPPAQMDEDVKKMMADGFTHRMWIPKGEKRYLDGDIVHSLPKGSVEMARSLSFSGKIPLGFGK